MATQSRKTGLPEFFADAKSAENVRRQFIDAPLEAARQPALGAALELATFINILPDAFAASQQRELERVKKAGIENDPRVAALETSIEQADELRTMAQRGQVRVQRALVAVATNEAVFHGFVSDADFSPLRGLIVRLTDSKDTNAKAPSATTDDDGYFRIALGTKGDTKEGPGAKGKPINLSQRIADLLDGLNKEPSAPPPESTEANAGQVEILKRGKLLHSDPVLVVRDGGSIYREYVISDTEPPSASDFREFMSKRADKPRSPRGAPPGGADEAAQGGAGVLHSTTTPAGSRSAKKKSPRGGKRAKPRSKK